MTFARSRIITKRSGIARARYNIKDLRYWFMVSASVFRSFQARARRRSREYNKVRRRRTRFR